MSQQPSDFNPYQAFAGQGPVRGGDQSFVSRTALSIARWQTFFAILMTIGMVGMMGIMSISMISDLGNGNAGGAIGGIACVGGISLFMYGLPALMLWRAANAARDYAREPSEPQLAQFASSQLSFWRTVGILVLVILGLYALIFVGFLAMMPVMN